MLLLGLLPRIQANIGFGGRLKALGMYLPPGRLIAQGVMRPAGIEERASCSDVGVMVVSDPS